MVGGKAIPMNLTKLMKIARKHDYFLALSVWRLIRTIVRALDRNYPAVGSPVKMAVT